MLARDTAVACQPVVEALDLLTPDLLRISKAEEIVQDGSYRFSFLGLVRDGGGATKATIIAITIVIIFIFVNAILCQFFCDDVRHSLVK